MEKKINHGVYEEMQKNLDTMYEKEDERKFKNYLFDCFWRVKEGKARADEKDSYDWMMKDKHYAGLFESLEKQYQQTAKSSVIDNLMVKFGRTQKNSEVLKPGEYKLQDINRMLRLGKDFERDNGRIEKVVPVNKKQVNEEKRQAAIKVLGQFIATPVDEEILPKGEKLDRTSVRREATKAERIEKPKTLQPERIDVILPYAEEIIYAITTKNSRGLAKYFGFVTKNAAGERFLICESMGYGNAIYIFKMDDEQYKKDIHLTKKELLNGKSGNSLVKKMVHNETYKERLWQYMNG